jgi:hypothetical protein
MMRATKILLAIIPLALLFWFGMQLAASESAEVVTISTMGKDQQVHRTRLWVVEYGSQIWLRAGSDQSAWYQQVRLFPEIRLEREDEERPFRASARPDQKLLIDRLMEEKYGWRERCLSWALGRNTSVPVLLTPK